MNLLRTAAVTALFLLVLCMPVSAGNITNLGFVESPDGLSFTSRWLWVGPGAAALPAVGFGPSNWGVTLEGLGLAIGNLMVTVHDRIHFPEIEVAQSFVISNVVLTRDADPPRGFVHTPAFLGYFDFIATEWDTNPVAPRTVITVSGVHTLAPSTVTLIGVGSLVLFRHCRRRRTRMS